METDLLELRFEPTTVMLLPVAPCYKNFSGFPELLNVVNMSNKFSMNKVQEAQKEENFDKSVPISLNQGPIFREYIMDVKS